MKIRKPKGIQTIKNWQVFPSTLENNRDQIKLWIAIKWVTCSIKLHSNSIIHRALKPNNTKINLIEKVK